jgi:hypothetical protein
MNGSLTKLSITDSKYEKGYRCISFYLDDILKLLDKLSVNRIAAITTKYRISKANKTNKAVRYLSIVLGRHFLPTVCHVMAFLTKIKIRRKCF